MVSFFLLVLVKIQGTLTYSAEECFLFLCTVYSLLFTGLKIDGREVFLGFIIIISAIHSDPIFLEYAKCFI